MECLRFDFGCRASWAIDAFYELYFDFLGLPFDGVIYLINLIGVPDFMASPLTSQVPPAVSWALEPFAVDVGSAIIVSAFTARFVLRRVPLVG